MNSYGTKNLREEWAGEEAGGKKGEIVFAEP